MSSFDRINAIENRIAQMDARLDGGSPMSRVSGDRPGITSNRNAGHGGVSFESLLNSLDDDKKFKPTSHSVNSTSADSKQFDSIINEASQKHGVEPALIRAVIKQESAYNPKATSHCGAMGLMQLMPDTAKDLGCADAYDPYQNIMSGTKYLRQLLDKFSNNQTLAVAAYNAGPGNVDRYGTIPPFPETQDYVNKVLGNYRSYKGMGA